MIRSPLTPLYSPVFYSNFKKQPSASHFGFSQEKPPEDFSYQLKPSDLNAEGHPNEALIQTVFKKLQRPTLQDPGFIVFEKPLEALGNADNVVSFLEQLMLGLGREYKKQASKADQKLVVASKLNLDGDALPKLGGYQDESKRHWVIKSPHFDKNSIFGAHLYLPTINVIGGNFQLFDVNQYLSDHQHVFPLKSKDELASLDTKLVSTHSGHNGNTLNREALQPYCIDFENDGKAQVVVFTNELKEGLAHSATPVSLKENSLLHLRPFFRVTLTHKQEAQNTSQAKGHSVKVLDVD
jgi:hypothetical protein